MMTKIIMCDPLLQHDPSFVHFIVGCSAFVGEDGGGKKRSRRSFTKEMRIPLPLLSSLCGAPCIIPS